MDLRKRQSLFLAAVLVGNAALPAAAADLFRCLGKNGETVFTGATNGYHECKRLASLPPGWKYLASAKGFSVYVHERPDTSATHGGWVLWDYGSPRRFGNAQFLSMVTHYQLDCAAHTGRIVSAARFTGNMMEGDSVASGEQFQSVDPVPGTVDDLIVSTLCERPAAR